MTLPTATYRVQVSPAFGFEDCRRRLGYLARLGVSHLYLSPIFEARDGSEHGYDVTDPRRVRAALGGREGFERLSREARAHGLGVIIDIVPNHMAASHENPWWWVALRDGAGSEGARVFDIDWEGGAGRVVLPVLGAALEEVLARGELRIDVAAGGARAVRYFDEWFPLRAGLGGGARGADELRAVLARQHYELVEWREGTPRRNYRRFFDIDHLVGVRVEDEAVFEETHELVGELWREGLIDGVRVDHVDGLARPGEYLGRLRALLAPAGARGEEAYIVVEKILEPGERLRGWPVAGTTGYEVIDRVTRLFVSAEAMERMERAAAGAGVVVEPFERVVQAAKREVLGELFEGELAWLGRRAGGLAGRHASAMEAGVGALCAAWPVYRTYLADGVGDVDRELVSRVAGSVEGVPTDAAEAVARLLTAEPTDAAFVERFEQLTGPVMAKGLEDTAHYRHAVLTAMNEVGGHPVVEEGDSAERFHAYFRARAGSWPGAMSAMSTHDTKRGEDARARILAIAGAPEAWERVLAEASAIADGMRPRPAPRAVVLMLQAAVAIWPEEGEAGEAEAARLREYMTKSVREAKRRSSWIEPDEAYESSVRWLVDAVVLSGAGRAIGDLCDATHERAIQISLVQTVLRLTVPGVPDTYQGSEWENRSLVDPDNRRAVDFDRLEDELARLEAREGFGDWRSRKLDVVRRLHALRRARRRTFASPTYRSVRVDEEGVLAFRLDGSDGAVVVAVRVGWRWSGSVELHDIGGAWREVLCDRSVRPSGAGVLVERAGEVVPGVVLVEEG